jgi:hypothetical protein
LSNISIDTLIGIEAIKQLKARYFRLVDTKLWHELADLFTEDARADFGPSMQVQGRRAIVEFIREGLSDATSVHHGHMPEITIRNDEADGVWAMQDRIMGRSDGAYSGQGYGYYVERYAKGADGVWRIADLRLNRLSVHPL